MKHVHRAKTLRRNMTDAEKKLWQLLRGYQLSNFKFRRQHPIGPYITDFACAEVLLIVEVDGGQHCDSDYDARRTAWLERQGWRVIRFWNNDVLENLEGVWKTLDQHLKNLPLHRKYPLPHGRGRAPLRQQREGEGVGRPDISTLTRPLTAVDLSHEGEVT